MRLPERAAPLTDGIPGVMLAGVLQHALRVVREREGLHLSVEGCTLYPTPRGQVDAPQRVAVRWRVQLRGGDEAPTLERVVGRPCPATEPLGRPGAFDDRDQHPLLLRGELHSNRKLNERPRWPFDVFKAAIPLSTIFWIAVSPAV